MVSVVGPPGSTRALARSLVSQLAAFRAPNDLRMLAAFDPEDKGEWGWMKWLPHARSEVRPRQGGEAPPVLLADSPELLARLLEGELGPRLEQLGRLDEQGAISGRDTPLAGPRLVLFVDGFSPQVPGGAAGARSATVMERGHRLRLTLILLTDAPDARAVGGRRRGCVLTPSAATVEERRGDAAGAGRAFGRTPRDLGLCEAVARSLAPLRLEDRDADAPSPTRCACSTCSAPARRRTSTRRRPGASARPRELRVPIGVTAGGEPSHSTSSRQPRAAWARTG